MTKLGRAIAALTLVAVAPLGCAKDDAATPTGDGGRCDLGAHRWKQTSPGACAESMWTFVPAANGTWNGTETGCASVTGTARYDGVTVTVDFQYDGGNSAGRYEWPLDGACRGAVGKVSWTKGPLAGQSAASTLSIAP